MSRPQAPLFALYRHLLHLFPAHLRRAHGPQMLQTLLDAHQDLLASPSPDPPTSRPQSFRPQPLSVQALHSTRFWTRIFADLLHSSLKEHLIMLRNRLSRNPVLVHAVTLGLILTVLGGGAAATFQGMLRSGANQPQAQMAAFYAAEIASGIRAEEAIPRGYVDLERSLEPFVIFYNDRGTPVTATGYLNQTIPSPPPGVFGYLRSHPTDTLTWQPRPDVRIAAVIHRVSGPNPGFLLSGRSLRLVEEQEAAFWRMAFSGWFVTMLLLGAGALLLQRAQRQILSTA